MARRPVSISSGARGKKSVEVLGIKELESRIRDIVDATVSQEAVNTVGDAADILYKQSVQNAQAVGVPDSARSDIFTYKKQPGGSAKNRKQISALMGVRKRGRMIGTASDQQRGPRKGSPGVRKWAGVAYREWFPGRQRGGWEKTQRSKHKWKSLVMPGAIGNFGRQLIGESLATMWELGTTKMPARPWFRPAITAARDRALGVIKAGFMSILERHAGKPA